MEATALKVNIIDNHGLGTVFFLVWFVEALALAGWALSRSPLGWMLNSDQFFVPVMFVNFFIATMATWGLLALSDKFINWVDWDPVRKEWR